MQPKGSPKRVRARAPLRLGFAGGGTDVSPDSDEDVGLVVNATIGKFAHATITSDDAAVELLAADGEVSLEGDCASEARGKGWNCMGSLIGLKEFQALKPLT
jgi:hypothetical protein